jgi:hypothetical protein
VARSSTPDTTTGDDVPSARTTTPVLDVQTAVYVTVSVDTSDAARTPVTANVRVIVPGAQTPPARRGPQS